MEGCAHAHTHVRTHSHATFQWAEQTAQKRGRGSSQWNIRVSCSDPAAVAAVNPCGGESTTQWGKGQLLGTAEDDARKERESLLLVNTVARATRRRARAEDGHAEKRPLRLETGLETGRAEAEPGDRVCLPLRCDDAVTPKTCKWRCRVKADQLCSAEENNKSVPAGRTRVKREEKLYNWQDG